MLLWLRDRCLWALVGIIICLIVLGCSTVPKSAIELSGIQAQMMGEYNKSIAALVGQYRQLIKEPINRIKTRYDGLIERAETWKKELYKINAAILERKKFASTIQGGEFQKHLTAEDKKTIIKIEGWVEKNAIDPLLLAEARGETTIDEITGYFAQSPDQLRKFLQQSLPTKFASDIEVAIRFLQANNVREVERLVDKWNRSITADQLQAMEASGKSLQRITEKIDQIDRAIEEIKKHRETFLESASAALTNLDSKLIQIHEAGNLLQENQKRLQRSLQTASETIVFSREASIQIESLIPILKDANVLAEKNADKLSKVLEGVRQIVF